MYVALQFSHVMEYTPSHIFCGSTLSFVLTSDLLMVLWGFIAVYTLYFFMIRDVVSDNPWTCGSTTMPLLLSSSVIFPGCDRGGHTPGCGRGGHTPGCGRGGHTPGCDRGGHTPRCGLCSCLFYDVIFPGCGREGHIHQSDTSA